MELSQGASQRYLGNFWKACLPTIKSTGESLSILSGMFPALPLGRGRLVPLESPPLEEGEGGRSSREWLLEKKADTGKMAGRMMKKRREMVVAPRMDIGLKISDAAVQDWPSLCAQLTLLWVAVG